MQRTEPEGVILLCDFCRRDWDGVEPMIEGHHGSILCLECLKIALVEKKSGIGGEAGEAGEGEDKKYACSLCLRYNIPSTLPHWNRPEHPESVICQDCLLQAAKAFSRNKDVDWTWDGQK